MIPVRYSNGQFGGMVLSSRVLAVNHEASTSASECESDSSKERSDVISLDVECLCDGVVEKAVPLARVKISTDPPVPTPFLLSLQDTLNRIAGLTPHRADLHSELTAAVDFPLWMQMMTHSAMTSRDISMIFTHVFSCIIKLQAPIRSEPFVQWTNEYLRLISACSTFESTVPLLPLLFEFTNSCIDEIRRDVSRTLYCLWLVLSPTF